MQILVTGGAGFIGRWVIKRLVDDGYDVWIIDDLSNSSKDNIREFKNNLNLKFILGDIRDKKLVSKLFRKNFDVCVHLAAQINVQESIENPEKSFDINVNGTYNILEGARKYNTKTVLVSTCMIYDTATDSAIDENHPLNPQSPYAASKLAAEYLGLLYYYTYKLPIIILRPFNTYGPFQKSNMEGGVLSIFIKNALTNKPLNIYGDGKQTRDFLYVEDCADFIVRASQSKKVVGEIINAGSGKDIAINDLAALIATNREQIKHIPHIHTQAEKRKLLCNYSKAKRLLNWAPKTTLEQGIEKTIEWFKNTKGYEIYA